MTTRLSYIDSLKGFLIILVVLGHVIQKSDVDFDHNIVFRYIYSFHMPLFMCISGFVCYSQTLGWKLVKKRFNQLMIPFLAWAVISVCLAGEWTKLIQNILHPDTALWFLWVLFFITVLHVACAMVSKKWKIKEEWIVMIAVVVGCAMMVGLKFRLFGFQFITWYFLFYCLGFYLRKYETVFDVWKKQTTWTCLFLFLVSAYWWMRKDPPAFMDSDAGEIYNYIYKGGVALLAIFSLLTLFRQIGGKIPYIWMLGKETLGIYAIHLSLLGMTYKWVEYYFQVHYVLFVIGVTLLLLIGSYYICGLLSMNQWTAKFLLGKKVFIRNNNIGDSIK